ncbi:hypothetical protein ACIGHB_10515 [Streptomyces sp. NPDC085460]|uniref:hypothetical protein n=1 Tax=Streptomyces sp. NPDC085460 TaxID=3365723 RepID=UPI0037D61868
MTQKLISGLEPPSRTAVFTPVRPDAPEGYADTAAALRERVAGGPGFLGHESARTPGGNRVERSYDFERSHGLERE